jgi:hypothetical protein
MDRPDYQRRAIIAAKDSRREELAPLRAEIEHQINIVKASGITWARLRPELTRIVGFPIERQRGAWWGAVGKRNGAKILEYLASLPRSEKMF